MDLQPSQVRKAILDGHQSLRRRLGELELVVDLILRDKATKSPVDQTKKKKCKVMFTEIAKAFLEHIQMEENILKPFLADADAWGAVRVANMEEEHVEQRDEVNELLHSIEANADFYSSAEKIKKFIKELYIDMQTEEEDCLSDSVLRDDVITISGSSE